MYMFKVRNKINGTIQTVYGTHVRNLGLGSAKSSSFLIEEALLLFYDQDQDLWHWESSKEWVPENEVENHKPERKFERILREGQGKGSSESSNPEGRLGKWKWKNK